MAKKTLLKSVILVESAAKARTLRKFVSRSFAVLSTEGFLKDLPKSRIGVDAENNYAPDYITVRGQGTLLSQLKKETLNARRIFLATNPDSRGEFLARQCCEIFGVNPKSFCRLWLTELTRAAFKQALTEARPIDEHLADAFEAKQILDKFVSHRIGEYFERKIYRGTKVGRFRAMLLKLIAQPPTQKLPSPREKLSPETLQELAFEQIKFSAGRTRLVALQLYEGMKLDGTDAGLVTFPDADEISLTSEKRTPESVKEFLTDYQFKLYELIYAHATGKKFTASNDDNDDAKLMAALDSLGVKWARFYAGGISSLTKRKYIVTENSRYSVTELGRRVLDALNGFFDEVFSADAYNAVTAQIRRVAQGEVTKLAVIESYCDKFNPAFDEAMNSLGEDSAPIDEPAVESDVVCEKCGRKMMIRHGRYGVFLACPGYPECKNTKPLFEPLEQSCPKCGAKLLRRSLPHGRKFYCCERSPECDFMTWDEPQSIKCQLCGATMFVHRFRGRAPMFYCGNENCSSRKDHPVNKILSDTRERARLRREHKEQLAAKAAEKSAVKPVKKSRSQS